jgi:hypothetical protein
MIFIIQFVIHEFPTNSCHLISVARCMLYSLAGTDVFVPSPSLLIRQAKMNDDPLRSTVAATPTIESSHSNRVVSPPRMTRSQPTVNPISQVRRRWLDSICPTHFVPWNAGGCVRDISTIVEAAVLTDRGRDPRFCRLQVLDGARNG